MHLEFPIRSDRLSQKVLVTGHLLHQKTEFQTIDIYETEVFGKALFLDGHIQLTSFDEHAYHEALVQIPLLSVPSPKTALVVGGGDGGVLRELVKHDSFERIDMVEIDEGVIRASLSAMPELSDGAFDDPRVRLEIGDAFPFVKSPPASYDIIVVDSTDTYEEEEGALSEQLFTEEFYRDCLAALTDRGLVVTQADNLVFCPYSLENILELFGKVFPNTGWYQAIIPSFGGFSGFAWGSKETTLPSEWRPPSSATRYLNESTYRLAFQKLKFG